MAPHQAGRLQSAPILLVLVDCPLHPSPASQVISHPTAPHILGQAPFPMDLRTLAHFPRAHSPRSQIGSVAPAAAPGPSVPSGPGPSPRMPGPSPPRAPNPDKGWLGLSTAPLGSPRFGFGCDTSGLRSPQPRSGCRAPPRDRPSRWPPRLRLRAADSAAPLTHRPFPTS